MYFFFLMIRRPPRSTLFPTRRSSDLPGFYSALAVSGYFQPDELRTLRQFGSRLQGHPVRYSEHQKHHSVPGIEYSGGSEGIGLSVGIGIALAKKLEGKKIGRAHV